MPVDTCGMTVRCNVLGTVVMTVQVYKMTVMKPPTTLVSGCTVSITNGIFVVVVGGEQPSLLIFKIVSRVATEATEMKTIGQLKCN